MRILKLITIFSLCLSLVGCHKHEYADATCTKPATCECGATKGEPMGHYLKDETCTSGKKCLRCDYEEGEPLGHDMQPATCVQSSYCSRCYHEEGEKLPHQVNIGYCPVCGEFVNEDIVDQFYDRIYAFDSDFVTLARKIVDIESSLNIYDESTYNTFVTNMQGVKPQVQKLISTITALRDFCNKYQGYGNFGSYVNELNGILNSFNGNYPCSNVNEAANSYGFICGKILAADPLRSKYFNYYNSLYE